MVYNINMRTYNKVLLFEYLLYHLIEWYKNTVSDSEDQIKKHFSRLTVLKLLFLTSAIRDKRTDCDLLEYFDNYYAMQYGPVESDIYNAIVKPSTQLYALGVRALEFKSTDYSAFDDLTSEQRGAITNAVSTLKEKNANLIRYNASRLIEITHKWEVWQNAMAIAEMFGKRSEIMPISAIRSNLQFYE